MVDPTGTYEVGGMPIEITGGEGEWHIRMPGVPDGFQPAVVRETESSFRIVRGPFDGAVATIEADGSGSVGPIPMYRADEPYEEPPGYGLLPPPHEPDSTRDQAFSVLLASATPGERLAWSLPYPKHEFVRWAMGMDRFIFHGSDNTEIEEFAPVRKSIELRDHGERGNVGAVYGTHDGLWSMFFAVVDRSALRGSIRNGVSRWDSPTGETIDTYQFSIHHECLPDRPYTTGALYLLPRATFRRMPFFPGGPPSDEWVSEEPVRPIVSIELAPKDFPFLDQIGGHDDGPLLAMYAQFRQLMEGATAYRGDGGLHVDVAWDDERDSIFAQWTESIAVFIPDLTVSMAGSGDTRTLSISGPESLENDIVESLKERLG